MKNINNICKHISTTILVILTIITLASCSKEEIADDEKFPEEDITLIDGRIVFADQSTFDNHVDWLLDNQFNENVIQKFYEDIEFKSMRSVYKKGMGMMDSYPDFFDFIESYPNVFEAVEYPDKSILYECEGQKLHAYFANIDGLYQIGNKICRISWNSYFEIRSGNTSLIPELFKNPEKIDNEEIFVHTVSEDSKRTQYYYATDYYGDPPNELDNYRMVSRHYKTILPGEKYYYVRTTSQKKKWYGWIQNDVDWVKVSWDDGYYAYSSGGTQYPVSGNTCTDYGSDVDILVQITNPAVDFSASYLWTTHSAKRGNDEEEREVDFWQ